MEPLGHVDPERLVVGDPERLVVAPDCGMKYLAREAAFGKLKSLAEGAALVRRELAGNANARIYIGFPKHSRRRNGNNA